MTRYDQFVTFVPVSDLEAATAFYRDRLGLEPVLDQTSCRIFRVASDGFLGICHDPDQAGKGGVILTLVTDLVDRRCAELVAAGVVMERAPRYNERFDIYHAFVRDPDGNLVEIQQFRDPRWPRE